MVRSGSEGPSCPISTDLNRSPSLSTYNPEMYVSMSILGLMKVLSSCTVFYVTIEAITALSLWLDTRISRHAREWTHQKPLLVYVVIRLNGDTAHKLQDPEQVTFPILDHSCLIELRRHLDHWPSMCVWNAIPNTYSCFRPQQAFQTSRCVWLVCLFEIRTRDLIFPR